MALETSIGAPLKSDGPSQSNFTRLVNSHLLHWKPHLDSAKKTLHFMDLMTSSIIIAGCLCHNMLICRNSGLHGVSVTRKQNIFWTWSLIPVFSGCDRRYR